MYATTTYTGACPERSRRNANAIAGAQADAQRRSGIGVGSGTGVVIGIAEKISKFIARNPFAPQKLRGMASNFGFKISLRSVGKDSLNNLMKDVSNKAGQGGKAEGAYFDTTDKQTQDMNKHALDQKLQNESTNKEAYSLTDNNCGTFVNDTLKSGGVDTPWVVDPRPNSMSGEWRDKADQKVDYDPKKEKEKK
jgi:hypothetical protein